MTNATMDEVFIWNNRGSISRGRFIAHARAVAAQLPDRPEAVNLCEDRYLFSVGFLATLMRGQTTLLPPSCDIALLRKSLSDRNDYYLIGDADIPPPADLPLHILRYDDVPESGAAAADWSVDKHHPALIAFTSGSTGRPLPHVKTWDALCIGTDMALRRFGLSGHNLVATVPPQHMYGMECTVLYPMLGRVAIYAGRPFFPEDVRAVLDRTPPPRVLITTPVHLKAFVAAKLRWPEIELVLSATTHLSITLANEVERVMGTRVSEIYGCTETGAIASRDTTSTRIWCLYDGMRFDTHGPTPLVTGPQLGAAMVLNDVTEPLDETHFHLGGRHTDQINVAGKRASLADLNQKLLEIEGVVDGVLMMPESGASDVVTRPLALVVAPDLDEPTLRTRLAKVMPAVFIPRPIYFVAALPRNHLGKLPWAAVHAQLAALKSGEMNPADDLQPGPSGYPDERNDAGKRYG